MIYLVLLSYLMARIGVTDGACENNLQCPLYNKCVGGTCVSNTVVAPIVNPAIQPTADARVCFPNPCENDCQCIASCKHASGFYCTSQRGFLGKTCTIPSPTLNCGENAITVSVSEQLVRTYTMPGSSSYIYVGNGPVKLPQSGAGTNLACSVSSPTSGFYTITIPLPFSACGTTVQSTGTEGGTAFMNEVWLNTNSALFDIPIPVFRWACSYKSNYNIVTSLRPTVEPMRIQKGDTLRKRAVVELCKVASACPNACPPLFSVDKGAVYTVSEPIHMSISIDQSVMTNNGIYLQELYLSCSASADNLGKVSLVSGGCSNNILATALTRNGQSTTVCVSFRVPRMLGCQMMYIHGTLASRPLNTLTACPGSNGFVRSAVAEGSDDLSEDSQSDERRKRSLERSNVTAVVAVGPIYIITGSPGNPVSEIFPGAAVGLQTKSSTPEPEDLPGTPVSRQSGLVILVIIVISSLILLCISVYVYVSRVRNVSK
uniref:ZP domain-containing protein n=1 Tax=Ciona savignyi TaxID=51511 RepID=H2Z1R6_CIOSA